MPTKKRHKDVEFHVEDAGGGVQVFRDWAEALVLAAAVSVSRGDKVLVDVVVWSRAGAKHWAGDHGVETYDEDPEASVFQRVEVKVEDLGRVA